ncbi:hypothetical protein AWENTII_006120 [Aspergillus wentii]
MADNYFFHGSDRGNGRRNTIEFSLSQHMTQASQLRRLIPILSSRDLTILALSPGRGFNSSLGSKLVFELFFVLLGSLSPSANLRSRVSSKLETSSDVIAMAVGLRRSIFRA